MPEWPIGHEEIDPFVHAEAAGEKMADADFVRPRHLELEAFETDRASHVFDVNQYGWQIFRVERGHWSCPVRPKE